MVVFVAISVVLYIVAFLAVYNAMHEFEKKDKYIFIISSFIIMYAITAFVVMLSTMNIDMEGIKVVNLQIAQKAARFMFAPINSFVGVGLLATVVNKLQSEDCDKSKVIKKGIIYLIICIVLIVLEKGYIGDFIGNLLQSVV